MIRPHIEIPVSSLESSTDFYSALLGMKPTTSGTDFLAFDVKNPPLSLRIVKQLRRSAKPQGNHGHFGIQLKSSQMLEVFQERFADIGVRVKISQNDVECCGTVQNKVWIEDNDGNGWELFVVVDEAKDGGCGDDVESCTSCPCNHT